MTYHYFVSYAYINSDGNGYGNASISRPAKIQFFNELAAIRELIEEQEGFSTIVILFYELLREEE